MVAYIIDSQDRATVETDPSGQSCRKAGCGIGAVAVGFESYIHGPFFLPPVKLLSTLKR